jgi:hypothetical protein
MTTMYTYHTTYDIDKHRMAKSIKDDIHGAGSAELVEVLALRDCQTMIGVSIQ